MYSCTRHTGTRVLQCSPASVGLTPINVQCTCMYMYVHVCNKVGALQNCGLVNKVMEHTYSNIVFILLRIHGTNPCVGKVHQTLLLFMQLSQCEDLVSRLAGRQLLMWHTSANHIHTLDPVTYSIHVHVHTPIHVCTCTCIQVYAQLKYRSLVKECPPLLLGEFHS